MSDDLISRQAAYKAFSDYLNRNFIGEVSSQIELSIGEIASVVKSIPTAFDKEKVIEELVELRQREYNDSDEESETMDGEEIYDKGRSQGRFEAYRRTIGIVEKGGIE